MQKLCGDFSLYGQCLAKGKRCSHCRKNNHFKKLRLKRFESVKEVQYTQLEVAKNHDPQSADMSSSDEDSYYVIQ